MNKPQPESDAASIRKKATEGVVAFAISLILTTGLVGGCTYLLFGLRQDFLQQNDTRNEIARINREDERLTELFKTWLRPETRRLESIVALIDQIRALVDQPLEPTVRAKLAERAQTILVSLAELKGEVTGASFSNPQETRVQQSLVQVLEPQIEIATVLRDLMQNWENLTINERRQRLDRVRDIGLHGLQAQSHHTKVMNDLVSKHEDKVAANNQLLAESKNGTTSILIKIALSGVGIAAGLLLMLWTFLRVWRLPRTGSAGGT